MKIINEPVAPTADGAVIITMVDGEVIEHMFKDIVTHRPEQGWYTVRLDVGSIRYPSERIHHVRVRYNTKEFLKLQREQDQKEHEAEVSIGG